MNSNELKELLIGRTIEAVLISESYDDEIHTVELKLDDGTNISLSPTSFNYGGQYLIVDKQ